MDNEKELLDLLRRIEANQVRSIEIQGEHIAYSRSQFAKAQTAAENARLLQSVAIKRAQRLGLFLVPIILFLTALVVYICVKWKII